MTVLFSSMLGAFMVPMEVSNDAWSFLYIVPLAIVLSVVYKTTKITTFTWLGLAKQSAILAAWIVVFMIMVAAGIYAVSAIILR